MSNLDTSFVYSHLLPGLLIMMGLFFWLLGYYKETQTPTFPMEKAQAVRSNPVSPYSLIYDRPCSLIG